MSGALGVYGIYSLQRVLEQDKDIIVTREGIKTHTSHDSVATASGATAGGSINISSQGDRPHADASNSKAGRDITVPFQ